MSLSLNHLIVLDKHLTTVGFLFLGSTRTFTGNETTTFVNGSEIPVYRKDTYSVSSGEPSSFLFSFIEELQSHATSTWETLLPSFVSNDSITQETLTGTWVNTKGSGPVQISGFQDWILPFSHGKTYPGYPVGAVYSARFSWSAVGNLVTFVNLTSLPSISSLSWDFGDGSPLETSAFNPTHTYAADGDYLVTLTVTDASATPYSYATTVSVSSALVTPSTTMPTFSVSAQLLSSPACSVLDIPYFHLENSGISFPTITLVDVVSNPVGLPLTDVRVFQVSNPSFPTAPGASANTLRLVKMLATPITPSASPFVYVLTLYRGSASSSAELHLTLS